jgi:hypothetical protein
MPGTQQRLTVLLKNESFRCHEQEDVCRVNGVTDATMTRHLDLICVTPNMKVITRQSSE